MAARGIRRGDTKAQDPEGECGGDGRAFGGLESGYGREVERLRSGADSNRVGNGRLGSPVRPGWGSAVCEIGALED